jgi:hypothetical protein
MAWGKKKPDPISDRAKMLNAEIASLEAQIKKLDAELQRDQSPSRPGPPTTPVGEASRSSSAPNPAGAVPNPPAPHEPIFEAVDLHRLKTRVEASTTDHYNELGVRKYDLPALFRRLRQHLRGPSTTNPKLVSYLAAGGLQGLRPLRYEKRVARNRFIALVVFLFLILLGTILVFWRQH